MSVAITMWLAGMPLAAAYLFWLFRDLPGEEMGDLRTWHGLLATMLFVALWPVLFIIMAVMIFKGMKDDAR